MMAPRRNSMSERINHSSSATASSPPKRQPHFAQAGSSAHFIYFAYRDVRPGRASRV